ncbi:MAG: glycosyltransferase [Bacteroidales bacterium]|nr:glycosyltransferase [Bacteroidales bacterium]
MKIAVDLTYIREETNTGLANYAFYLLKGFRENGLRDSVVILTESGFGEGFAAYTEGFRTIPAETRMLPFLPFTRGPLFRRKLEAVIKSEGIGLLLSPYIYDRSLYARNVPCIGVIHDTKLFYQGNPILRARYRIGAVRALNRLERIVAISGCTRDDLIKIPGVKTGIEVIHNSVVSNAGKLEKEVCNPPYILDVNTLLEHKNPLTLLKAFELVSREIPHNLVFKGSRTPYWDTVLEPYIASHSLSDRVELNETRLSQEEMEHLYRNADLFVSPSMMEGFGFTPIEAALAGVPVICNDLPALVESTRGLVTYYSPAQDASALADKILYVLENREYIKTEEIRGEFASAYSPSRQAECFAELISSVCGRRF